MNHHRARARKRLAAFLLDESCLTFTFTPTVALFLLGFWLAMPWHTFATGPPVWQALAAVGPEWLWASVILSVSLIAGSCELFAEKVTVQNTALAFVCLAWLMLSVMVWRGAHEATIAALYPMFCVMGLWGLLQRLEVTY